MRNAKSWVKKRWRERGKHGIIEIKPYMEGREISLVMRGQKGGGRPMKLVTAREM